jgi:hypothetical protein
MKIGIKGGDYMKLILNKHVFEHAKQLVEKGSYVFDEKDMLSEHQPSANEENEYIEEHGFEEYSKWYSGVDADENEDTKGRYKFPYHSLIGVYN